MTPIRFEMLVFIYILTLISFYLKYYYLYDVYTKFRLNANQNRSLICQFNILVNGVNGVINNLHQNANFQKSF